MALPVRPRILQLGMVRDGRPFVQVVAQSGENGMDLSFAHNGAPFLVPEYAEPPPTPSLALLLFADQLWFRVKLA